MPLHPKSCRFIPLTPKSRSSQATFATALFLIAFVFFEELSSTAGTLRGVVTKFAAARSMDSGLRSPLGRHRHTADDGDDFVFGVSALRPKKLPRTRFAAAVNGVSPIPSAPPTIPSASPRIATAFEKTHVLEFDLSDGVETRPAGYRIRVFEKNRIMNKTRDLSSKKEKDDDDFFTARDGATETETAETADGDWRDPVIRVPPFAPGFAEFVHNNPLRITAPAAMRVAPYRKCSKPCRNQGRCNHQTGLCVCPSGFAGFDCGNDDAFPCDDPYNQSVLTRCAGHGDLKLSRCQCGPHFPFPKREIGSWCMPVAAVARGTPRETWPRPSEYTGGKPLTPWHWVFGAEDARKQPGIGHTIDDVDDGVTRGEQVSWCFANASATNAASAEEKSAARCAVACPAGMSGHPDCDEPRNGTFCPNQCSGGGVCLGGFCVCHEGRWGGDCSLTRKETKTSKRTQAPPTAVRRRASPLI